MASSGGGGGGGGFGVGATVSGSIQDGLVQEAPPKAGKEDAENNHTSHGMEQSTERHIVATPSIDVSRPSPTLLEKLPMPVVVHEAAATPATGKGGAGGDDEGSSIEEEASWLESVTSDARSSLPIITRPPDGAGGGGGSEDAEGMMQDESIFDDLPVFADDRSKLVNEEVKGMEKALEDTEAALKENRERLRIMEEHLFNVQQEVQHTNLLVDAKRKEQQTDEHLRQLSLREQGRLRNEVRRGRGQIEEFQDKLNGLQNAIFKANEEMDQFKLQMNWNQEEMEQWAIAAKQKEEDNLVLEKYARNDESKIKELSLQLEKITQAMVDRKSEVENEVTTTQAKQMELDRIAEDFKVLHHERKDLVRQWQASIEAMKKRDVEINDTGVKYAEAKHQRQEQWELLTEHRERIKMQEEENEEIEVRTQDVERTLQKRRLELLHAQEHLQHYKDELDVLKSELSSNAAALNRRRSEISVLTSQFEERRKVLEIERKKFQGGKRKLEIETSTTERVEETVKDAEINLNSKEYNRQLLVQQLEQLKGQLFKSQAKLSGLRLEESNLVAEVYGAKATNKSVNGRLHLLDSQSTHQQELLYNAEFQIQQMERKVARGLGERSDEEKKVLQAQIKTLEGELQEVQSKRKMLVTQSRKLGLELRTATRHREGLEKETVDLEQHILEVELENSTTEHKVKETCREKEELMVQTDLLKLEMKRLRDMLTIKKDELFSLENRKQQLIFSMEERRQEIAVHRDTQRALLRVGEEEKRKVVVELNDRAHQVEKLKARFDVLAKGGISKIGEDGEEESQAYFIIKAAQKREELQREGDNLDQEIQKCEREIRAMQDTLNHLVSRNGNLRTSLQKAQMTGQVAEELCRLEDQAKLAQNELFHKKKRLQRLNTDVEEDLHRLEQVQNQCQAYEDQNLHLKNAKSQVQSELTVQKDSISKVERRLVQNLEAFRSRADLSNEDKAHIEKVLKTQVLREATTNLLFTLGQLAKEFPESSSTILAGVSKAHLKVPKRPVRPLSAQSSQSSDSERSSARGGRAGSARQQQPPAGQVVAPTEFEFGGL